MNTIKSHDIIFVRNLTSRIRYACLMAAVLPLSVFAGYLTKGYVTDGLVVYWDAIDNVGTGTHDPNAATWKNLGTGGSDYDLTIYHGVWADGNSLSNGICKLAAYGSTYYTYTTGEFVIDSYKDAYSGDTVRYIFADKDRGLVIQNNLAEFEPHKCMTDFGFAASKPGGIHTLAYDHGNDLPYFDGGAGTFSSEASAGFHGRSPYYDKFFLGVNTNKDPDFEGAEYGRGFHGKYYAIRLYSRSLTAAEIARNQGVDAARFKGVVPSTGAVVIASNFSDLAGSEPNGIYFPEEWTFSSGAATKNVRGFDWSCSGYRIQTWDPSTSSWGAPTTVTAAGGNVEWTSPAGTDFASRRITWLWQPVSGMRSAADYAASDYVSEGLAVYWDAIDNAGTGTHDPNAATWKNLGTGGSDYDLTIYHGVWADGNSLSNGICKLAAYGSTYYTYTTGEFVIDSYKDAYSGDTVRYIFADKDRGLVIQNNLAEFEPHKCMTDFGFAASKPGGIHTLAYDHGNDLPYFDGGAGTFSSEASAGFHGRSPYYDKFFLGVNTNKDPDFEGAEYGRGFHGKYYAIRLYSRSLGVDELAWNCKVDAARFQGVIPCTNIVVIANEWSGGLGGSYEVLNSCTVSGSPSSVDGKNPNKCIVWTLQGDGTWGNRVTLNGASYTYDVVTSPATVRIEFGRNTGLCIVCR